VKRLLLIAVFAAGTSLVSQAAVDIGINIGPPPAPRVLRVRPVAPGRGYTWVDGYWYAEGGRYRWHSGYWTRPPYEGYVWVGPRYEGGRFFPGYWNGERGRVEHDHRWDRERDRDYNRH
jgi:hypothetical protein